MPDETEHKLSDPKRIHWILSSLMKQHQLIKLSLPGTDLMERSMVVSVCSDMSSFMLDAATDSEVHKKISNGQAFSLSTTHDGVDVRAETVQSVETLNDAQGMLYRIPFPSQLLYIQRRDSFRVSLAGLFTVPVSVELPAASEENPIASADCSLSNISANGCLLSVPGEEYILPSDCEEALLLTFELPETNERLSLESRICHSRHLKRSSLWLIGFEFQNLPADTRSVLERYVVKLQLLARQKSALG